VIPLGDSVPRRQQPVVTQALIAACVLIFLYELTLRGLALDRFIERWGAVPRIVLAALAGDPRVPRTELLTLFTSEFLHAGFLHLGGNMLFLWVFGRAVEDRLGHLVYLVFYLLVGALAALAQSFIAGPAETVPLIGASGAIAGVLGLYFVSYPGAWVRVLMPILFFFWTFDLPAVLVLAFWFLTQFVNGVSAITRASSATEGGVAVWAHVTGFLLGAVSAKVLPSTGPARAPTALRGAPMRRADAPGPARLVSSVADLLALLLVVRLALLFFFGLAVERSPIGALVGPIVGVTNPLVEPFAEFMPAIRIGGGVLEVYTLVAIITVYVLAGLIGQLLVRR
jgi:membrane associated rhomboid family serine protease